MRPAIVVKETYSTIAIVVKETIHLEVNETADAECRHFCQHLVQVRVGLDRIYHIQQRVRRQGAQLLNRILIHARRIVLVHIFKRRARGVLEREE
jgi:hypothetical protein